MASRPQTSPQAGVQSNGPRSSRPCLASDDCMRGWSVKPHPPTAQTPPPPVSRSLAEPIDRISQRSHRPRASYIKILLFRLLSEPHSSSLHAAPPYRSRTITITITITAVLACLLSSHVSPQGSCLHHSSSISLTQPLHLLVLPCPCPCPYPAPRWLLLPPLVGRGSL